MNEIQEIRYQVGEAWKGAYHDDVLYGNANVVQDNETLSVYRSIKSGNVGHPLSDQNWWFCIIDMSRVKNQYNQMVELEIVLHTNETGRVESEAQRRIAETNRETRAESDHAQAGIDHTRAESDHSTAASDHTQAGTDHTRAESDHTRAEQDHANIASKADVDGTYPKMAAGDIASWKNSAAKVEDMQTVAVFTTGGDASINSGVVAQLLSIVAASRTAGLTGLTATGFNLLRGAAQIGSGQVWYFPVPYLKFGNFGTADENNGVLFTGSNQEKLMPTVYWKALSAGVPTSATDGVVAGYTESNGYRFYTTPTGHEGEMGYFIVQATRATTCAHIAWSSRYDEYIAVDNANDVGASIALTSLINNLHSNGLMYKVGAIADGVAFAAASAVWSRRVERVQGSDLTWTDELQDDGTTYKHTATIATMKADGAVECSNAEIALTVSGQEVSYTDSNATAITTDYIYFQLAAEVNGTVAGAYTFAVEDWGLIMLTSVSGTVASAILYGQNLVDTLRLLATSRFDSSMRVIAEALNQLSAENKRKDEYIKRLEDKMTPLQGADTPSVVPSFFGQNYIDTTNKKVYVAVSVTGQTSDWIGLN